MTELQRYLAEEVAEDHADGLVSRREALRRLGLLGLGGAAAASLLAGFLAEEAKARMRRVAPAGAADGSRRPSRRRRGRLARSCFAGRGVGSSWVRGRRRPKPRGGVLVIHENRGLNDSIRADRRAAWRRAATPSLAIDLLSEEGGTGSFADEFEAMAALGAAPPVAIRGGHEGGGDGASPSAAREEGRRDRVLLRRRHDVAAARLEGVAPGGGRALLRPVPRGREPRRRQGGGARDLRGARLEGQREPPGGACGAPEGRTFGTRSSRTRASTTRSSTRPGHGTTRRPPRPPTGGCWAGSARTSRARRVLPLCLVVLAVVASGAAGGTSSTALTVREYPVPAGSRPHDVAPARDGGVWYTAQGSGELGWLDPKTGPDAAHRSRGRLGAARCHRRARRCALDHRRRAERDRPGRPEDAARPRASRCPLPRVTPT